MRNQLQILKYALPGAELKIDKDGSGFYLLQYGHIKVISTDGIDNGITQILNVVNNNIFEANLWSYNDMITKSINLYYSGDIPGLQFFKDNNIKIMTRPTGVDYVTGQSILPVTYQYDNSSDINFADYAYIHKLMDCSGKVEVDGLKK